MHQEHTAVHMDELCHVSEMKVDLAPIGFVDVTQAFMRVQTGGDWVFNRFMMDL